MTPLRFLLATACLSVAVSFAQAPALAQTSASADVAPAEAARFRAIAERSQWFRVDLATRTRRIARESMLAAQGRRADLRTVFIGVDLVDMKDEREGEPNGIYRVRHYRYVDDTTITSLIDAETGRVIEQTEAQHVAVPLSSEELADARTLALADRRVVEAVGGAADRLVVEPLVVRTSDREDRWFGRRIVRLLFRQGRDYLSEPTVYVDLTSREVMIETGHARGHGEVQ